MRYLFREEHRKEKDVSSPLVRRWPLDAQVLCVEMEYNTEPGQSPGAFTMLPHSPVKWIVRCYIPILDEGKPFPFRLGLNCQDANADLQAIQNFTKFECVDSSIINGQRMPRPYEWVKVDFEDRRSRNGGIYLGLKDPENDPGPLPLGGENSAVSAFQSPSNPNLPPKQSDRRSPKGIPIASSEYSDSPKNEDFEFSTSKNIYFFKPAKQYRRRNINKGLRKNRTSMAVLHESLDWSAKKDDLLQKINGYLSRDAKGNSIAAHGGARLCPFWVAGDGAIIQTAPADLFMPHAQVFDQYATGIMVSNKGYLTRQQVLEARDRGHIMIGNRNFIKSVFDNVSNDRTCLRLMPNNGLAYCLPQEIQCRAAWNLINDMAMFPMNYGKQIMIPVDFPYIFEHTEPVPVLGTALNHDSSGVFPWGRVPLGYTGINEKNKEHFKENVRKLSRGIVSSCRVSPFGGNAFLEYYCFIRSNGVNSIDAYKAAVGTLLFVGDQKSTNYKELTSILWDKKPASNKKFKYLVLGGKNPLGVSYFIQRGEDAIGDSKLNIFGEKPMSNYYLTVKTHMPFGTKTRNFD